jgi:hypothetical protein
MNVFSKSLRLSPLVQAGGGMDGPESPQLRSRLSRSAPLWSIDIYETGTHLLCGAGWLMTR